MPKVLILGAGGTGRDIVDWLPELAAAGRPLDIAGFLDDDPRKKGATIAGLPVLGTLAGEPGLGFGQHQGAVRVAARVGDVHGRHAVVEHRRPDRLVREPLDAERTVPLPLLTPGRREPVDLRRHGRTSSPSLY